MTPKKIRCAVYTRKSSEEGLEQAFNSLDAQREACEAYIKSQVGEGWVCSPDLYDDGGISGGTMDRPSLKALLADIALGLVDCVVVYKVDRLTRSLTDFAKIIEAFDAKGVSFVSVTQAFNTTSSMGRLTLNVLLSFAQFEREVTGERIRDKIAASKKKGMWMGGIPPLGYDLPTDKATRALAVNEAEASTVRDIFQRYLRLESVNAVRDELARDGVVSKRWTTAKGRVVGGCAFTTGSIFHLLQSRVYVGEITHGKLAFPGIHRPLVDRELFDSVQKQLAANTSRRARAGEGGPASLLKGLVFDAEGHRMGPAFAYAKSGKRHAYYVSVPLQKAIKLKADTIGRVSAAPLEELVLDRMRRLAGRPCDGLAELRRLIRRIDIEPETIRLSVDAATLIEGDAEGAFGRLQSRLVGDDRLDRPKRNAHTLQVIISVRPVFRGGRTWIVSTDGKASVRSADRSLLKALALAHRGLADYNAAPTQSPAQWRQAQAVPDSYLRRLMGAAFLAPDIQRAILEGRQPAGLTGAQLMNAGIPLAWADQRKALGFTAQA